MSELTPVNFLLYNTEDGRTHVQMLTEGETCWLSQKAMAELFETTVANINQHVKHILEEGELDAEAVIKDYLITASDGKSYKTKHYRLEMVLAVGFRVRSPRGTQFRSWAIATLQEFLLKGFVMDDERLKQAKTTFGKDYFDELLERIRDIRASERRFYQKITDIYATAVDYNSSSPISQTFFATVQNKLEWAITGMTAAELIHTRADASKPNMGLETWSNGPDGAIRKKDVTIAKNYLTQEELEELNRFVGMFLDYAEDQAKRQKTMSMQQWAEKLDNFLIFNDREVLKHLGRIRKDVADRLAHDQYDQYKPIQQAMRDQKLSDFDKLIVHMKSLPKPKSDTDN